MIETHISQNLKMAETNGFQILYPDILALVIQCPTGEWDSQLMWDNPNNLIWR